MRTFLVIDGTNLLHRVFFANWKTQEESITSGLALHSAFVTFNKYYQKYQPTNMFVCFDRSNWRKEYTKSEKAITTAIYKGNRYTDLTPSETLRIQEFHKHIEDFETILRENTSIKVLSADKLEADDLVAGMTQQFPNDRIIIISTDKDFIQLLRTPNIMLIDPDSGKPRECEDPDWFIFEKCFRGDRGDNVRSAYPRVRSTRLEKAYTDEFERLTIMNETWVDPLGNTVKVGDLFQENKLLMDLTCQPSEIRQLITDTINNELGRNNPFSYFHFRKFCSRHDLKKISERCSDYAKMLSNT